MLKHHHKDAIHKPVLCIMLRLIIHKGKYLNDRLSLA